MEPDSAIRQIMAAKKLRIEHGTAALEEARALATEPGIDDPSLLDLTHLPFVTIDEEHSKDLDQALFLEEEESGFVVWYAIADAAWFVKPGSALFAEALERGGTYYLPGLVVPMLPAVLSEDLISLNPGVDRRALVFKIQLDASAEVRCTEILRARIRSRLKTWYDAVQAWHDGTQPCPGGTEIAESLRTLARIGESRMRLADSRNVVRYRRSPLVVKLEDGDAGFVGISDLRNDIERWNEQISLLCNMEGAAFLQRGGAEVHPIYRVHEPPAAERLDRFAAQTDALIRNHNLDRSNWEWNQDTTTLKEYLEGLPHRGAQGRIARAIHRQAMISGGSASFSSTPARHFGVGADLYARFTAPMREIVGVFLHKEAWEALGATPHPARADEALRDRIIEASMASRKLQRQIDSEGNRLVLDAMFERDLAIPTVERPRRAGTIMGITRGKVHVQLDDPPIDVKVYVHHLGAAFGRKVIAGNDGVTLRDRRTGEALFVVGDEVAVWTAGKDATHDRWELGLERAPKGP